MNFLHLIGVTHTLTLAYSKQDNAIVERYNKEINRHLRALTFENLSLTDYKKSLPFVQRIPNSNNSDWLKISAPQMLFGNMLNLDKGIFIPISECSSSSKPLSQYMSDLLAIQDNLLKASAEELLRTDLLHMTTKEQNIHKEYLPNSANSFAHELDGSYENYQRIKFPLYTPRPHNWQREGLPCVKHEAYCL